MSTDVRQPTDTAANPAFDPVLNPDEHPRHWIIRQWCTASGAVVAELRPGLQPQTVFERLARRPSAIFFDSAALDGAAGTAAVVPTTPRLGRYSFVAADPIHSVHVEQAGDATDLQRVAEAFALLRSLLADLACQTIPGLPPFQGGVAGLVSYECGLARLGVAAPAAPAGVPLLSLHVYDVIYAFDHDAEKGWIISQGVPARGPTARRARAEERLASLLLAIAAPANDGDACSSPTSPACVPPTTPADASISSPLPSPCSVPLEAGTALPGQPGIVSTRSRAAYLDMVQAGIELIRAGDIFQANLAQRLSAAVSSDPVELHRRSRTLNPAPFAGCFNAGGAWIVSMSPERLLQVGRGTVRMHPIKGTRRILAIPEADLYAGAELGGSEKDRAENVMIVDLVRNDLSRVCTPASVHVEALCRLERYRYVQHLVSIVAGRLRPGLTALDALDAAIPGGSVTGAPKQRACEIIGLLEGFTRGAYCGSLGFIGLDGTADFNLLIRTFVVTPDSISFAVGGGITAQSDPAAEYAETLHKAEGMLRVLASFTQASAPGAATATPSHPHEEALP